MTAGSEAVLGRAQLVARRAEQRSRDAGRDRKAERNREDDLLAVPATGAYTLAMASNYNGVPRPAAVLVRGGSARLIRRRETIEDLLRAEVE